MKGKSVPVGTGDRKTKRQNTSELSRGSRALRVRTKSADGPMNYPSNGDAHMTQNWVIGSSQNEN